MLYAVVSALAELMLEQLQCPRLRPTATSPREKSPLRIT